MEVLQGNQSGSRHSRRRLDRLSLGENRALDWGSQDSDIELLPLSPLALADVLSQEGGFLDLLPVSEETTATSTQPARSHKERCNLLTRHDTPELMRRCKKILVENALIKDKGDRQLYLCAGFISWPDTSQAGKRQRAPVLLFPALLVRIPDQQRYEIRLTGDSAEYNQALVMHAEQRFATQLPDYDSQLSLSSFFEQLTVALKDSPTLSLDFDTALGSAALFHASGQAGQSIKLPDIPLHFDVGLAMSITGNKSLEQLSAVLQLIPDYNHAEAVAEANQPATSSDNASPRTPLPATNVASLRKYAARLAAEGLDHVEFRQLSGLPDLIGKWTRSVSTGLNSKTVSDILRLPELSARELIRLAGIIELIDKAPSTLEQFGHGDLCYSNSTILMRRAQHQARQIEQELTALQKHFILDKVPGKSQLLSLISELGETLEHDPEFVDSSYFHARRQFMEFSVSKPANLTTEHRRLLAQLAKVMRFRELFVNNTEYRAALGPGYRGLRTDWEKLSLTGDYARELAEVLESETIASLILRNWQDFRATYSLELNVLLNAADACRRLLSVVGTRWQSQSVASLLVHAQLIASRLSEWRNSYGPVENHADKTPAMVLSSFSGRSRDDIVVENQVDETRERINRQLQEGEIHRQQITDTLAWLLEASQKATELDMDIDAIVEHLQIA